MHKNKSDISNAHVTCYCLFEMFVESPRSSEPPHSPSLDLSLLGLQSLVAHFKALFTVNRISAAKTVIEVTTAMKTFEKEPRFSEIFTVIFLN